jgi:hypothetical protein
MKTNILAKSLLDLCEECKFCGGIKAYCGSDVFDIESIEIYPSSELGELGINAIGQARIKLRKNVEENEG